MRERIKYQVQLSVQTAMKRIRRRPRPAAATTTAAISLLFLHIIASSYAFQSNLLKSNRYTNERWHDIPITYAKSNNIESFTEFSSKYQPSPNDLSKAAQKIQAHLSRKYIDWNEVNQSIQDMLSIDISKDQMDSCGQLVQDTLSQITQRAFSCSTWDGVKVGLQVMELQAGGNVCNKYNISYLIRSNSLPRNTALQALKALNNLMKRKHQQNLHMADRQHQANASFRILQRLCTGVGLYNGYDNSSSQRLPQVQITLDERDFCMVLNGFVNTGQMNMAHRVVALQERTAHAPPLSPVNYSILIKGYGRLKDSKGVDNVLEHARQNNITPDIIMYNSLIDAYINCDNFSKARNLFEEIRHLKKSEEDMNLPPVANLRTYNTMLKGYIAVEDLESAMKLAEEMQRVGLWDAVTTNTLVGVAVAANKFDVAESILYKHTVNEESLGQKYKHSKWHPNVEAYTELLDGYAKAGYLSKALNTLKTMRKRGVKPNEITYTCIIGALAKSGKTEQAEKLITFMRESDGINPGVITYNAFFTGMLVEKDIFGSVTQQQRLNVDVDKGLEVLSSMMNAGIKPNAITITLFVDALGRSIPPRLDKAKALIQKTCNEGIIPFGSPMVSTALIRACGYASDLEGALIAYESISTPDLIAFNALLDTCCRCKQSKRAIQILERNRQMREEGLSYITPDVASYGSIISCLLKVGTPAASNAVKKLYTDMKSEWMIAPDHVLIDA